MIEIPSTAVFGVLAAVIIALIVISEVNACKCPKCGARMVWNQRGYDKWDCMNCGHCQR